MPGPKRKQPAAANKPPKEKPLDNFIPTSYMALLEGTLLTNGDLKVRNKSSGRPLLASHQVCAGAL